MPNDLICWPAYPFRREPVRKLRQASLQNHPRGVPFSLMDSEGKHVWLVVPTADQTQRLQQAFPTADLQNPPWAEVFVQLSRRGMSSPEIEKMAVPAILKSLAPVEESDDSELAPVDKPRPRDDSTGARDQASPPPSPEPVRDRPAPTTRVEREVDWPGALAQMKGDDRLLHDVAGVFLSEISGMLERVRQAIESRDGSLLRCAAQSLRESLAYIKAKQAYDLASRLEAIGRSGNLDEVEEVYSQLEKKLGRVKREVASLSRIRAGRG